MSRRSEISGRRDVDDDDDDKRNVMNVMSNPAGAARNSSAKSLIRGVNLASNASTCRRKNLCVDGAL